MVRVIRTSWLIRTAFWQFLSYELTERRCIEILVQYFFLSMNRNYE